jgi:hypothetical protein
MTQGLRGLGLAVILLSPVARAQQAAQTVDNEAWQQYNWLGADDAQQRQAASESATVHVGQDVNDPFSVLANGSLWQQKIDAVYARKIDDMLTLNYETTSVMLNESSDPAPALADGSPDDLSRGQTIGLQFKPSSDFTLSGNVHETTTDSVTPGDSTITGGAGLTAQGHLPLNTTLTLSANSDHTGTDGTFVNWTTDNNYDAQLQKPLGNLPLTAVLDGHYEEISTPGVPAGNTPSLAQSLVWKPLPVTTVQMGLRQQQYQEYPGITNQFNEALFADWSQNVMGSVSWHSYAEVLNSRGMIDQAPASPIATGANGTPQATIPGSNASLTDTLPISLQDQTVTFTTGPSFQLQKDISASLEYSDRWNKNPVAGSVGQEQRVSLSVKGSF